MEREREDEKEGKEKAEKGDTKTWGEKSEADKIRERGEWKKTAAQDLNLDSWEAMWREIIGMALAQQGGLSVYTVAPTQAIARAHFGASMDYQLAATPAQAMAAIDAKSVAIMALDQALAPAPQQQVVARLPAIGPAQALCYGMCGEEDGENDVTLVQADLGLQAGVEIFADATQGLYELDGELSAADIAGQFGSKLVWLGTYRRPVNQGAE